MNNLEVKIKKLYSDSILPSYATDGSAALDMYGHSISHENFPFFMEIKTGVAMEIPVGYVGLLSDRSSVTNKLTPFSLKNSLGIIDSDFRGEIRFRFNYPTEFMNYFTSDKISKSVDIIDKFWKDLNQNENGIYGYWEVGSRIGQILIVESPKIKLIEVEELTNTKRGEGGFGSSGK